MSTALAAREPNAPAVTADQLDLVKRTVANGASDAELKLYLYDCQRQGVHPLDRLLHFTKRGGKYTPVTSIDLMRIRAAETGEYAGSDDAEFVYDHEDRTQIHSARVAVWRLVQGTRYAFTATARWDEYYPGDQGGHMWRKMGHTMLAKCAEALALRKGFPRQLAGLYASEELDQADKPHKGYVVEAPVSPEAPQASTSLPVAALPVTPPPVEPNGGDSAVPDLAVLITRIEPGSGGVKGWLYHTKQPPTQGGLAGIAIFDERLKTLAEEVCQTREPVFLKTATWGRNHRLRVSAIERVHASFTDVPPITDAEIPF